MQPAYYEDFTEIKKKIWSMLENAVTDRGSQFRIPVFICGDQSDFDGRIVVLRKSDHLNNLVQFHSDIRSDKIKKLKKNIFLDFKPPNGRGDISKVKLKDKQIYLVDETYNSNPLSLKIAIENYDKIKSKNSKKYLILGDMLELGKHSIKQHKLISKIVNKTKIYKVYVIGNYIKQTFKGERVCHNQYVKLLI